VINPGIDSILTPKPAAQPRLYAYAIAADSHAGLLKIGQTTRDVKQRVAEQLQTAAIDYTIVLDEPALREDGSRITDHEVRNALNKKGFENPHGEWMRCTVADVKTVLLELRTGRVLSARHHLDFPMRAEQARAVRQTFDYFQSRWQEDETCVPRFLWNAKMRFGKTFACYQLAKKLKATRILVLTFKPAVEDAWKSDLESHVDFNHWRYLSRQTEGDPGEVSRDVPLVYFGSFQDLLGRDKKTDQIKARNEWLHASNWDLVVFDEYHFGAWRETARELFEGEEDKAVQDEYSEVLAQVNEVLNVAALDDAGFLPITTKAYLYLSGTPFKALASGEFIEEQIFNWNYTDEQRAKAAFAKQHPAQKNPYAALPQLCLMTYQMPDELLAIASGGEFDEFDLNAFFAATGEGEDAQFTHAGDVQKWLDILRGQYAAHTHAQLKTRGESSSPPFPYSDERLLPYLQHAFWFLPDVAACHAMANLLAARHNVFWHDYTVVVAAGAAAGTGLAALAPVRTAIGNGFDTKTITLSCGKLTTGVTVPQWSSILILRNLSAPETYFQAAFRVQSPWSIANPHGNNPHEEDILKPACFVFDFAPTRALRQLSEYGMRLSPGGVNAEINPEDAVRELVAFLPVLAFDGANMTHIDAGQILDIAMAGTSATLLARKWESAVLVNVDNHTLRRVLENADAMAALERIEGWRALGNNVIETIINQSAHIKALKTKAQKEGLSAKDRKALSAAEKAYQRQRKQVQEKLIKFATRIPAFMYLTDFRENTLQDVITKLEPDLFETVTGLTVADFHLLVQIKVFNTERMNEAVFAFRRYEDASLRYTGIESGQGPGHHGLYDTVVVK